MFRVVYFDKSLRSVGLICMLWLSESYNIIHDYFAPLIKM